MRLIATMKYEIVKPVSCDWDFFSKCLREVMNETQCICNRTIQLLWEWQGYSAEYKKLNGQFPKPHEVLNKSLGGYVYNRLRQEFPTLQSGNLSQTLQRVIQKWKSDLKEVSRGERSIASFKREVPIEIHKRWIRLRRDNHGNYIVSISLLSQMGASQLGLVSGVFEAVLATSDGTKKTILDRVLTGIYSHGASQFKYNKRKRKWFFHLTYTFDAKQPAVDPDRICGVDLGKVVVACCAVSDSNERLLIDGGEIDAFRQGISARRRSILRAAKYAGKGRGGHGRTQRVGAANVLKDRVANFRNTKNEKYARDIVDFAVKHRCGKICLENLGGISKDEKFLKDWTYFDLGQKIEFAALKEGIRVQRVNPAYTSQRCSKCGYIDEENRQERTFRCNSCGYKTHADYNAACNIALGEIETVIAIYLAQHLTVNCGKTHDLPF